MSKMVLEFYKIQSEFSDIRCFNVIQYDFVFDFIVVSCSLVSGAIQYDLFQIKRNSDNSMSFVNFIRTFDTEQRANIVFVALTKI